MQLKYSASAFDVFDNWRQMQVTPAAGNLLMFKNVGYALQFIHFHSPAEPIIDGDRGELGIHFIHATEDRKFAIIAVKVKVGEENPMISAIIKNFPDAQGAQRSVIAPLQLDMLLPKNLSSYYNYRGSITIPPCFQTAKWIILKDSITMSQAQIDAFKKRYDNNVRPVQPLNGRSVYTTK